MPQHREGRGDRLGRTPLQQRVDFLIRLIMLVVAVMSGAILARAVLDGQPLLRFVQTAAVLSGLVPYGLFLLSPWPTPVELQ